MGAAEDYGVGAGIKQGLEAGADRGLGVRTVEDAFLYQFDESLAYVLYDGDALGPFSPCVYIWSA